MREHGNYFSPALGCGANTSPAKFRYQWRCAGNQTLANHSAHVYTLYLSTGERKAA